LFLPQNAISPCSRGKEPSPHFFQLFSGFSGSGGEDSSLPDTGKVDFRRFPEILANSMEVTFGAKWIDKNRKNRPKTTYFKIPIFDHF